jgi:N-acetylmuramoyl-L-alanine amidase
MRPVGRGDTGKRVVDIQTRLAALGYYLGNEGADGVFGPNTENAIRAFQQGRLLCAGGVVEANTWTELVEAGYKPGERLLYLRVPYMRGDDVLSVQRRLDELGFACGPVDGIFSPSLEVAITEFQRNTGLNVDGIVGDTTWDRLRLLQKSGVTDIAGNIPDRMNGYVGLRSLSGFRVVVDPGHGGADEGCAGVGGLSEKDVNLALGVELARVLAERGAVTNVTREDDATIALYDRIESANAWQTDLYLSLHHSTNPSKKARGAAAYYFANTEYEAKGGKRLAGYIVDALVRELGRVDLRKHGRNYACLREVKPLAIMIEPGYLSHPEEGPLLAEPEVLIREAVAISHGIEAYLARL